MCKKADLIHEFPEQLKLEESTLSLWDHCLRSAEDVGEVSAASPGPPAQFQSRWQSVIALGIYAASLRREPGELSQFHLLLVSSALSGRSGGRRHESVSDGDGEAEPEQGDARGPELLRGAESVGHRSPCLKADVGVLGSSAS